MVPPVFIMVTKSLFLECLRLAGFFICDRDIRFYLCGRSEDGRFVREVLTIDYGIQTMPSTSLSRWDKRIQNQDCLRFIFTFFILEVHL